MGKQKICIIGGGLTGLVTALALSRLNVDIDLITENINKNFQSNRTVAISQNNKDFLNKIILGNIENFPQKQKKQNNLTKFQIFFVTFCVQ